MTEYERKLQELMKDVEKVSASSILQSLILGLLCVSALPYAPELGVALPLILIAALCVMSIFRAVGVLLDFRAARKKHEEKT